MRMDKWMYIPKNRLNHMLKLRLQRNDYDESGSSLENEKEKSTEESDDSVEINFDKVDNNIDCTDETIMTGKYLKILVKLGKD